MIQSRVTPGSRKSQSLLAQAGSSPVLHRDNAYPYDDSPASFYTLLCCRRRGAADARCWLNYYLTSYFDNEAIGTTKLETDKKTTDLLEAWTL